MGHRQHKDCKSCNTVMYGACGVGGGASGTLHAADSICEDSCRSVCFLFVFPMPGLFSGEKGEKVCELFFFASKHFSVSRMLCFC